MLLLRKKVLTLINLCQVRKNPQGLSFHLGEKPEGYEMLDLDKNGNTALLVILYNYQDASGSQSDLKQQYANSDIILRS